jgi:hypothetical protein
MCRTVTLVVALAAFTAASAFGTPASSVKSHRRASGSHAHHHPGAAESAHRTVSRGVSEKSTQKSTRRPTPQEVGRAAGLKIRREMERRAVYRHRATRATGEGRYRRARLVETAHVIRYPAERSEPTPVASYEERPEPAVTEPVSPAPAAQPFTETPETEAAERPEATSQSADDRDADSAGIAPAQTAEETAHDSGDEQPTAAARSEDEVASLTIPHGAMPAPLKGSLASLERQNDRLTAEGLERIENEDDLAARIANHLLVPVPASDALTVNPSLPPNHRYCRPWTARFLADLARDHEAVFHRPLEVSSAVRTVAYQKWLMEINGNAAPAEGDIVSPHMTGATIDIAKEGLSRDEVGWMRSRLLQLQDEGKIDVEEEFQQACFHITVYKTYAPPRATRRAVHAHPQVTQPSAPAEDAAGSDTEGL